MKQVTQTNISGIVFTLDQDAYKNLRNYLDEIQVHYASDQSAEEIISDIESSIAEKLSIKRANQESINAHDIAMIISQLGTVSDLLQDSTESDPSTSTSGTDPIRRLYRNKERAVISGVSAGLADYFSIDAVWVRLAFVISIFFSGVGVIIYIVLWIAVPQAQSTSQKLHMQGRRVSLDSIARYSEKKIADNPQAIHTITHAPARAVRGAHRVASQTAPIARTALGILVTLFSGMVIVVSTITASALLLGQSLISADPVTTQFITDLTSGGLMYGTILSVYLVCVIPFILLLCAGIYLISRRAILSITSSIIIALLWVASLSISVILSIILASSIATHALALESHAEANPEYEYYFSWQLWSDSKSIEFNTFRPIDSDADLSPASDLKPPVTPDSPQPSTPDTNPTDL